MGGPMYILYNISIFGQIQIPGIFSSSLLNAALCSSWEHRLYGVSQALTTDRQIFESWARQVKQCRTKGVEEHLERDFNYIKDS